MDFNKKGKIVEIVGASTMACKSLLSWAELPKVDKDGIPLYIQYISSEELDKMEPYHPSSEEQQRIMKHELLHCNSIGDVFIQQ